MRSYKHRYLKRKSTWHFISGIAVQCDGKEFTFSTILRPSKENTFNTFNYQRIHTQCINYLKNLYPDVKSFVVTNFVKDYK